MVEKSIARKSIKFILQDIVGDVLFWPIWWYTTGVIESFYRMTDTIVQSNLEFGLTIWIKNIFVPMYGDYSWQGRLVSLLPLK